LGLSASLQAADTIITWGMFHTPPSIDLSDLNNPKGMSGEILVTIQKGMPGYEHRNTDMSLARIHKSIADQVKVCNHHLFKTKKRQKIGVFSLPNRINLPLRIVLHKETHEKLGGISSISLEQFLDQSHLYGLFEKKRSYGSLDRIVKPRLEGPNIKEGVFSIEQMTSMLLQKRIDFFLEYSFLVDHLCSKSFYGTCSDLRFVAIEEAPPFAYSHVICPKNEWGEQVIKDVNAALESSVGKPEYLKILQSLYTNEQERALIREYYYGDFLGEYGPNVAQ
ncbi:MAG: hypothetical protein ABW166_20660, partial [Sedimenticola sp.]